MTDHAVNINAFDGLARAEYLKGRETVHRYPTSSGTGSGQTTIAQSLNLTEECVSLTNGLTELIAHLPQLLQPSRALIVSPTFWQYEFFAKRSGVQVEKFHLRDSAKFDLDLYQLRKELQPGDLVFICNVNNPTGNVFDLSDLPKIATLHHDVNFFVDESYLLFWEDWTNCTLTPIAAEMQNIHVGASLSKFYAIPGERAGYFVSDDETMSRYRDKVMIPYSITSRKQGLVQSLVANDDFALTTRRHYAAERFWIINKFQKRDLNEVEVFKPSGNFVLMKFPTVEIGDWVSTNLESRGLHVRTGRELDCLDGRYIRWAIRSRDDNQVLLSALFEILSIQQGSI